MKYRLVAFLGLILVACATTDRMNRLSVGMTKAQVVAAMGEPTDTRAANGVEYLHYALRGPGDWVNSIGPTRDYFVRLRDGHVDAYGKAGDFDLSKVPEAKINVDLNTPKEK